MNQRGYTLLELLIAMTVIGILSAVMINFLLGNLISSLREEAQADLQSNTKLAADNITSVIRSAQTVEDTNSITDSNQPAGWTSDSDTIVLAVPALDSDGEPIYTDSSQNTVYSNNAIYYVQDNKIWRRTLANPNAPDNAATTTCPPESATQACPADVSIVGDIASLNVDYFIDPPSEAEKVKLTLERQKTVFSKVIKSIVTTTTTMRNK